MNLKIKNFIRGFSYAIVANLISFIVSILVVLVVPKIIGVEEYGYWQIYVFYSAYVAFLHFGWSDGIYLKIGGKKYKNIDKQNLFTQFYSLLILQITISIIVMLFSYFYIQGEKKIIFTLISFTILVTNMRSLLVAILQATNEIREYSKIIIIDKIFYFGLLVIILVMGGRSFEALIISDILGRTISFIYAIYICKDIVFRKSCDFSFSIYDTIDNLKIGIKLTLAYIASLLIIGVVRFGIELVWDIETFGKVSFSLSISNLIMVFINAIGILIFPILRRIEEDELQNVYIKIKDILMISMLGLLITYYPLQYILPLWLPSYTESLPYIAILFPMFIYESKMAILNNTFLKNLRKEKIIMYVNILSLVISITITILSIVVLKNLYLGILTIIIVLAFRSTLSEVIISNLLNVKIKMDIIFENLMIFIFILSALLLDKYLALLVYCVFYSLYLIFKILSIKSIVKFFNSLIKRDDLVV